MCQIFCIILLELYILGNPIFQYTLSKHFILIEQPLKVYQNLHFSHIG